MGISNLLNLVSTISRPVHTRYTPNVNPQPAAVVIIDGPALAYHIHRRVVNQHPDAAVNFPYSVYKNAIVKWLDDLERYGLKVKHIFVDGQLPGHKLPTRLSRIESHICSLRKLNRSHPPPAPFIIPAFVAVLASHPRYGSVTMTVPGEADAFCAAAAASKDEDTIIFTSDSDLLLYNMSPRTNIAMLSAITFGVEDVTVGLWLPHEITRRLFPDGNGDMVGFAWQVMQDQYQSVVLLVKRAQELAASGRKGREYAAFRNEYRLPYWPTTIPAKLRYLDSRLAELVYQSSKYRHFCHPRCDEAEIRIFLPLLIEDPARSSAWPPSQELRMKAYSLLFPVGTVITEIYRKGGHIGYTPVTVVSLPLSGRIRGDVEYGNYLTPIIIDIVEHHFRRGNPLSKNQILALAAGMNGSGSLDGSIHLPKNKKPSKWTSDAIQLYANLQAALYSLHLLNVLSVACGAKQFGLTGVLEHLNGKGFVDVYCRGSYVKPISGWGWVDFMFSDVKKMEERVRAEEEGGDEIEDGDEGYMGMTIG